MNSIQQLEELLSARASQWGALSIQQIYNAEDLWEGQPQMSEHLFSQKAELLEWLQTRGEEGQPRSFFETPVAFLARKTQVWLQSKNQFLRVGAALPALSQLYQQTLEQTIELLSQSQTLEALRASLEALFAAHHQGFIDVLAGLDRDAERAGFIFQRAICAEYSAGLQHDILGLEALRGPILDVGCGASAGLVLELRRRGLEAYGIDHFATPGAYTQCVDWFEYTFAPSAWGAILSHLAFSHHFMHHHLKGSPEAARYAQRYMEILRALRAGGVFYYAPSLPFIEALLPAEEYLVSHRPIQGQQLQACAVQRR